MPIRYNNEQEKWEDLKFTGELLIAFEEADTFWRALGDIGDFGHWKVYYDDVDFPKDEWECIDAIYRDNQNYELYRRENYFIQYNNGRYEYWADKVGCFKPEFVLRWGFKEIDFTRTNFSKYIYSSGEWKKPVYFRY